MEELKNDLQKIDKNMYIETIKEYKKEAIELIKKGSYEMAMSYILLAKEYEGKIRKIDEIIEDCERGFYDD